MRRLVLVLVCAGVLLLLSVGTALAGPQPLPAAACNQGTLGAAAAAGATIKSADEVPHLHNFDGDTVSACYHFNVTFPPPHSGLE